jgi:hypothetical protein
MNEIKVPDFLIVGAQKAGTTSLHFALSGHRSVFMSDPKELNFFQDDKNYSRGIGWYCQYFADCAEDQIAGESSPEYFHCMTAAERIATVLPKVKIIVLLRNPIDRAYSAYWHAVRHAGEHLTFKQAISKEPKRILRDKRSTKYFSYLSRSCYIEAIREYFRWFPSEKISIIIAEEYFRNPVSTLKELAKFLSVDCYSEFLESGKTVIQNEGRAPKSRQVQRLYAFLKERFPFLEGYFPSVTHFFSKMNRAAGSYPQLEPETRSSLRIYFEDSIDQLEDCIGRDLSIWKR